MSLGCGNRYTRLKQNSIFKVKKKHKKGHPHKPVSAFKGNKNIASCPSKKISQSAIPVLDRLGWLKKYLDVNYWCPKSVQNKRRLEFNKIKTKLLPLEGVLCFTCGDVATVRHHIIPICRWGINVSRNLVPLCNSCHFKLHPWVKEPLDILSGYTDREIYRCHSESESEKFSDECSNILSNVQNEFVSVEANV